MHKRTQKVIERVQFRGAYRPMNRRTPAIERISYRPTHLFPPNSQVFPDVYCCKIRVNVPLESLLEQTTHDDPHVRQDAFLGIQDHYRIRSDLWDSKKAIKMAKAVYEKLCHGITDTNDGVRETAYKLLIMVKKIWDKIKESDTDMDMTLLELEQECLDIYLQKAEYTRKHKADLYEALAEVQSETTRLRVVLGERFSFSRTNKTLEEQLSSAKQTLDDLRVKYQQRVKDFSETESQIIRICAEIAGNDRFINNADPQVNEDDLTINRLSERKSLLEELRNEKVLNLQKIHNHMCLIHELPEVTSLGFMTTRTIVGMSMADSGHGQSKSISNDNLVKLIGVVNSLKQGKQRRLQKIQDLGSAQTELWNLSETPTADQKIFEHATYLILSTAEQVSVAGALSQDVKERAEIEVEQWNILKGSKMKELVLKRQTELKEIYKGVHMDVDNDSGNFYISEMLLHMDDLIRQAKEAAHSKIDILHRVENWRHALEEEIWLDGYEKGSFVLDANSELLQMRRREWLEDLYKSLPLVGHENRCTSQAVLFILFSACATTNFEGLEKHMLETFWWLFRGFNEGRYHHGSSLFYCLPKDMQTKCLRLLQYFPVLDEPLLKSIAHACVLYKGGSISTRLDNSDTDYMDVILPKLRYDAEELSKFDLVDDDFDSLCMKKYHKLCLALQQLILT